MGFENIGNFCIVAYKLLIIVIRKSVLSTYGALQSYFKSFSTPDQPDPLPAPRNEPIEPYSSYGDYSNGPGRMQVESPRRNTVISDISAGGRRTVKVLDHDDLLAKFSRYREGDIPQESKYHTYSLEEFLTLVKEGKDPRKGPKGTGSTGGR